MKFSSHSPPFWREGHSWNFWNCWVYYISAHALKTKFPILERNWRIFHINGLFFLAFISQNSVENAIYSTLFLTEDSPFLLPGSATALFFIKNSEKSLFELIQTHGHEVDLRTSKLSTSKSNLKTPLVWMLPEGKHEKSAATFDLHANSYASVPVAPLYVNLPLQRCTSTQTPQKGVKNLSVSSEILYMKKEESNRRWKKVLKR